MWKGFGKQPAEWAAATIPPGTVMGSTQARLLDVCQMRRQEDLTLHMAPGGHDAVAQNDRVFDVRTGFDVAALFYCYAGADRAVGVDDRALCDGHRREDSHARIDTFRGAYRVVPVQEATIESQEVVDAGNLISVRGEDPSDVTFSFDKHLNCVLKFVFPSW